MSLSDLWKSPEWKKASKEFTEGKPCAWCGAEPGDTYETRNGSIRKLGFSPHHVEKHKWGLPLYNQVKNKLFSEYWRDKQNQPMFMVPLRVSRKEYRDQQKYKWENENRDTIKAKFEEEKQHILNEYSNLSEDHIVVLCSKCHYAREKGMVLCKTCGKGYHRPKYDQCWNCNNLKNEGSTE